MELLEDKVSLHNARGFNSGAKNVLLRGCVAGLRDAVQGIQVTAPEIKLIIENVPTTKPGDDNSAWLFVPQSNEKVSYSREQKSAFHNDSAPISHLPPTQFATQKYDPRNIHLAQCPMQICTGLIFLKLPKLREQNEYLLQTAKTPKNWN